MPSNSSATVSRIRPLGPVRRPGFVGYGDDREQPFISSGRLAILMVIAAELMLFSGLIGSFLVYRLASAFWPPPGLPRLPIQVTWANTCVLLSSAITMTLAVRAIRRNQRRLLRQWLGTTLVLGVTFLSIQGTEWVRLISHGLRLSSGAYGGTFYILIGCHGLHVAAGVTWLACVCSIAMRGRYSAKNCAGVELCALYWYFVCMIWPLLFGLVYLM
jgi:heme/copper-type cytochrome/quinol oxidase subunit 3